MYTMLATEPLTAVVSGVIVAAFIVVLLVVMNAVARRKQKKSGIKPTESAYREGDGASPEAASEDAQGISLNSSGEDAEGNGAPENAGEECRNKLRSLQQMLREGLITQEEYEREKRACLEKFVGGEGR